MEPRGEGVAQPDFGTVGPFTSMPRRNLIYHVWPVRGAWWQWNLDQLKGRVDMFNGRRILGIVHDDRSVQQRLSFAVSLEPGNPPVIFLERHHETDEVLV